MLRHVLLVCMIKLLDLRSQMTLILVVIVQTQTTTVVSYLIVAVIAVVPQQQQVQRMIRVILVAGQVSMMPVVHVHGVKVRMKY